MNVLRSRNGCVCACSRQDNDEDMQSSTTAVETDSYYEDDRDWRFVESSSDVDAVMLVQGYHAAPDLSAWEHGEVDVADLGKFDVDDIDRTLARFRRISIDSQMDDFSEVVWVGASPSASIMLQQEVSPERSMADSDISFGLHSSEVLRHAGDADLILEYTPQLTVLLPENEDGLLQLIPDSLRLFACWDCKQRSEFASFDLW